MGSGIVQGKPSYVTDLEQVYGVPSQAAFGSSVFYDPADATETAASLEHNALAKYKYFCGETWERFGEDNWLRTWKQVYSRAAHTKRDIVTELRSISESSVRLSAPMLLDSIQDVAAAHAALAHAFDDPKVADLRVFNIGDDQAMSGLLIAAQRPSEGSIFLVFLLD